MKFVTTFLTYLVCCVLYLGWAGGVVLGRQLLYHPLPNVVVVERGYGRVRVGGRLGARGIARGLARERRLEHALLPLQQALHRLLPLHTYICTGSLASFPTKATRI